MNTIHRILAILITMLIPIHASAWVKTYQTDYAMGDTDSITSARMAAIDKIKQQAINESGSYLQSTKTLKNGQLEESIQVLQAASIAVSIANESIVNTNGRLVLKLSANVTLDETELARRIKLIESDQQKSTKLSELSKENALLRQQLATIQQNILQTPNANTQTSLIAQLYTLRDRLNENQSLVTNIFTPGTLLNLAEQSINSRNAAIKFINSNLYQAILHTPIQAEITGVIDKGPNIEVIVRIGWNFDLKLFNQILHSYKLSSTFSENDNIIYISSGRNDQLARPIFEYIYEHPVDLVLSLGKSERRIPVLYDDREVKFDKPIQDRPLSIFNAKKDWWRIPSLWQKEGNPISIVVSKEDAQSIGELKAEFKIANWKQTKTN